MQNTTENQFEINRYQCENFTDRYIHEIKAYDATVVTLTEHDYMTSLWCSVYPVLRGKFISFQSCWSPWFGSKCLTRCHDFVTRQTNRHWIFIDLCQKDSLLTVRLFGIINLLKSHLVRNRYVFSNNIYKSTKRECKYTHRQLFPVRGDWKNVWYLRRARRRNSKPSLTVYIDDRCG